jgi:solute carrier family 25 (mitochondrial oxoglutarate transporter), member 11
MSATFFPLKLFVTKRTIIHKTAISRGKFYFNPNKIFDLVWVNFCLIFCSQALLQVAMSAKWDQPLYYYFIAGGIGDMTACCFSHPLDFLKVRMQLRGELSSSTKKAPMVHQITKIAKKSGWRSFYDGLSASLLRQSTFSTLRHGGYASVCAFAFYPGNPVSAGEPPPPHPADRCFLIQKLAAGVSAGCLAAFLTNPTDTVLIRMQSDGHWPRQSRRNYKHCFDGLYRTAREEGWRTLWRGCRPNVIRATLITSTQLPAYYWGKLTLAKVFQWDRDSTVLHVCASLVSASIASIVTAPVDIVKTRLMNMQSMSVKGSSGEYTSAWDCVKRTVATEGIFGLYKGLIPTFARLAPHTIVMWVTNESVMRMLR